MNGSKETDPLSHPAEVAPPIDGGSQPSSPAEDGHATVLGNSMAGFAWTVASRVTGLGKMITVGAVLGVTYLGNTYQTINALPNLVYYQLLAGSLFASLLVPPLVRHLDEGDGKKARVLVDGFLGTLLLLALAVAAILLAVGPLIMRLLTLGVNDPAIASSERRIGWLFLAMFVPQIALYVVAGTGAAVMNASGRFALAAAAPALESLGIIATLVVVGLLFGTGTPITQVSTGQLLMLSLGTTAAVGIHAACQWLGARSSGLTMMPGMGWKDPEVRRVLLRIVPTLGYTGLAALQIFSTMVVADRIPGGLIAFQLALNFFYLPTALVAWPMARALLPQLARHQHDGDDRKFSDDFRHTLAVAAFVTIPIAATYIALASPLAHALAFGQLRTPAGIRLTTVSLATLAVGVVGETGFILGTYALYAKHDVRSPLQSMAVRVGVSMTLMVPALMAKGPTVVTLLGLSLSAGSVAGSVYIGTRLRPHLLRTGSTLFRSVARTVAAATAMGLAEFVVAWQLVSRVHTHAAEVGQVALAGLAGLGVFLAIQTTLRAPELASLRAVLRGRMAARAKR